VYLKHSGLGLLECSEFTRERSRVEELGSFRAPSGRLKCTVRRHKFNKDSLSWELPAAANPIGPPRLRRGGPLRPPLSSEEGTTENVFTTFALKMAQAKARIWPYVPHVRAAFGPLVLYYLRGKLTSQEVKRCRSPRYCIFQPLVATLLRPFSESGERSLFSRDTGFALIVSRLLLEKSPRRLAEVMLAGHRAPPVVERMDGGGC